MYLWCLQILKKNPKNFLGFLKRGQIKKGTFLPLIGGFSYDSLTLLFWFDLFLETGANILEKKLLGFW